MPTTWALCGRGRHWAPSFCQRKGVDWDKLKWLQWRHVVHSIFSLNWWATSWNIHLSSCLLGSSLQSTEQWQTSCLINIIYINLSILFSSCFGSILDYWRAAHGHENSQCWTHFAEQDQWRHGAGFGARVGCGKPKLQTWETWDSFGVLVEMINDAGSTAAVVRSYKCHSKLWERERVSSCF